MNLRYLVLFVLLGCLNLNLSGQVIIKELAAESPLSSDSLFFNITRTRNSISLKGKWQTYLPGEKEKSKVISIPSNFVGTDELVFEKDLDLSPVQIKNNDIQIYFLGINYSGEISVNNYVIYKHPGGSFPFKVDLPRDILNSKGKNTLSIKITHNLNSDITIPPKQGFLLPENHGGIISDVYINLIPRVSIYSYEYTYRMSNISKADFYIGLKVKNNPENGDTLAKNDFVLRIRLIGPDGRETYTSSISSINVGFRKEKQTSYSFSLSNPVLWFPQSPNLHKLYLQLYRGEELLDEVIEPVSFYALKATKNSLLLNENSFTLNGTTYLPSYQDYSNLTSIDKLREDFKIIKNIGFNAVRFAKAAPHPYSLKLCSELGLLAFIEIPINSIPEEIAEKENFNARARSYLMQFTNSYKNFTAVAALGLGSSYTAGSFEQSVFIHGLAEIVKKNLNKLTYASFTGFDVSEVENLDLYGVEFYNNQVNVYKSAYEKLQSELGKGKVFVAEATYSSLEGSTNGYLNPFSYEAQAKFYSDLLDYSIDNNTPGYFINSIFDYRGSFPSVTSGYNENNIYKIGILGEDRESNRLSEKVVFAKLHNSEKVTIPIGSKKDDAPMVFILQGMGLALFMGFLINSKRKFREDASRALLRPYNFYADIRDQRIISGFHSNFLMIILAGTSALLLINLLFYFRSNILLEKFLLAFGIPDLLRVISYLAWNPADALLWLTVLSIIFFIVISIVIKFASFFVKNQVFFSNIYYTVIWAFLPLILLLPLGLILYKILTAEFLNLYILAGLAAFTVWIYYRLMKGIHVIFDVNPGSVYFYSLVAILILSGGILLYFQFTDSTVYYLINAYNQYKLM